MTLPEIPLPGNPLYPLLGEIQLVHTTYAANKKADEDWMEAFASPDKNEYLPATDHLVNILNQVRSYEQGLDEAKAPLRQAENLAILNQVRAKYLQADQRFAEANGRAWNSEELAVERVANRLVYFPGVQFCLDLDKTLTQSDKYLKFLPHARQFENYMEKNGRDASLPFVMARYAKEALVRLEPVYEKIGSTLEFRPGVLEFFHRTKKEEIPLSIISANFKVLVVSCLKQIPAEDRTHLAKVTGLRPTDITATDKETVTAKQILAMPGLANFLCLDGLSDTGCLQGVAKGLSAVTFVLKDTDFAKDVVKPSGQPYIEFTDFHQVNNILDRVIIRRDQLRQELGGSTR